MVVDIKSGIKQKTHQHYLRNKEYYKKYRQEHKEKFNEYLKLYRREGKQSKEKVDLKELFFRINTKSNSWLVLENK